MAKDKNAQPNPSQDEGGGAHPAAGEADADHQNQDFLNELVGGTQNFASDDAAQAMAFDPFDRVEDDPEEGDEGKGTGAASDGRGADAKADEEEEESPPDKVITGDEPEGDADAQPKDDDKEGKTESGDSNEPTYEELKAELEAMRAAQAAAAAETQASGQPSAQQKPAEEKKPEEEQAPNFAVAMPQELMNLLESEDPAVRAQGYSALVKGVGEMVYHTTMAQVKNQLDNRFTEFEQGYTTKLQQSEEQRKIQQDFYKEFPNLDDPSLRAFVGSVAQTVVQETGAKQWTPELGRAIGMRATRILKARALGNDSGQRPAGEADKADPKKKSSSKKPATQIKSGARPASSSGSDRGQSFIEETLFGGG